MASDGTEPRAAHWDRVYAARPETELTWFEAVPALSMDLIRAVLPPGEPLIDIGGGASRLVDALLNEGFGPVTVLDLSETALRVSRDRLGVAAAGVEWIVADVTRWVPPRRWALWHDRAVFHFLTAAEDRRLYAAALDAALAPGGTAIVSSFDETGPQTCSGLPVVRYSPEAMAEVLAEATGGRLHAVRALRHGHVTPRGATQAFQVSVFRKS